MAKPQVVVLTLFVVFLAAVLTSTWIILRWPDQQVWVGRGLLLIAGLILAVGVGGALKDYMTRRQHD